MAIRSTIKVYAIAEISRCPRCLQSIDLPLEEAAGGKLSNQVCPHCEAVVGVRAVKFGSEPDDQEEQD